MRTYLLTLTAVFRIRAENVAQARLAAKRVRAIGETYGRRRPSLHDRDALTYSVERLGEAWDISPDRTGGAP